MDHAAAHERIADLALEPGRLAALDASPDPLDRALLDHTASCGDCRTEVAAWQRTQTALGVAFAGQPEAEPELVPIRAPESLRTHVVAALSPAAVPEPVAVPVGLSPAGASPAGDTRPARRGVTGGWPGGRLVGLAAAVVVLVVGGAIVWSQLARLDELNAQGRELQQVVAAVDRVLADDDHHVAELRAPDGARGGSISWSRHDLVVLTTALAPPSDDQLYRCWLSENGEGWAVGQMYFAGDTGYWVGSVDEWAAFEIGTETVFRVSLEPANGDPTKRAGPIVLEADLGGYASRNQ